jgi:hypothetical protein
MTAIQILEKLGADASFNPNNLTDLNKTEILELSEKGEDFNAALILSHSPAEEEVPEEDPEEKPAEKE